MPSPWRGTRAAHWPGSARALRRSGPACDGRATGRRCRSPRRTPRIAASRCGPSPRNLGSSVRREVRVHDDRRGASRELGERLVEVAIAELVIRRVDDVAGRCRGPDTRARRRGGSAGSTTPRTARAASRRRRSARRPGGFGRCSYGTGKNGDWKIVLTHAVSWLSKAGAKIRGVHPGAYSCARNGSPWMWSQ